MANVQQDQRLKTLETNFEVWCDRMLEMSFKVGITIPWSSSALIEF